MCSIGEDDFGDEGGLHVMQPEAQINESSHGICNKCGAEGEVFKVAFRSPECRECFLLYVRHKFRATLGSSKILPKNAKVLLVFDGSAEAMVLLDMLHHAQTQNKFKRLHCAAQILHIDDSLLLHPSSNADQLNKQKQHIREMRDFLQNYAPFESYILPIGCRGSNVVTSLVNFKDTELYLTRNTEEELKAIKQIESIRSLTSRQDYLKHQQSHLIAAVADHFDCRFAFVSDISSTIAAQLLSAVALGRGGSAIFDVALVDERLGANVKLVRPIKDLSVAEVQLYFRAQQLRPPLQSEYYGKGSMSSLQNLTRDFITDLQQNFSSTITTVVRTGEKLKANNQQLDVDKMSTLSLNETAQEESAAAAPVKTCAFCNSLIDYGYSDTLLAIEYSRIVSEDSNLDPAELDAKARSLLRGDGDTVQQRLCHACRNIQKELGDGVFLID